MSSVKSSAASDSKSHVFSREAEDELDRLENQKRTAGDTGRVDAAFVAGSAAVTALWATLWTGAVGGTVAAGSLLLFAGN